MLAVEDQWTLNKLYDKLGPTLGNAPMYVRRGGIEYAVGGFHSWRGFYPFASVDFAHRRYVKSAYDLYDETEKAIGSVFEGWKGGEYTMTEDTPVFVDHEGECDGYGIYDMIQLGDAYVLLADKVVGWS